MPFLSTHWQPFPCQAAAAPQTRSGEALWCLYLACTPPCSDGAELSLRRHPLPLPDPQAAF